MIKIKIENFFVILYVKMLYYYHLLRFNITSILHIRNRKKFDQSWKNLIETRRRLRVVSGQKSYFQKIKEHDIFKYL